MGFFKKKAKKKEESILNDAQLEEIKKLLGSDHLIVVANVPAKGGIGVGISISKGTAAHFVKMLREAENAIIAGI